MQKIIIGTLILILLTNCKGDGVEQNNWETQKSQDDKLEVLLLGTFHFANFNPENNGDIVDIKIRDILNETEQNELELISDKIKAFKPDKIFVEIMYNHQNKLDSIYSSFSTNDYSKEKRDELTQLAFRTAKKLNHKKLYAMDYRTEFRYDSLMQQMEKAKQFNLIAKDSVELAKLERTGNELFASNKSLTEILYFYNDDKRRKEDINWYVNLANQGGEKNNFVGAYLASEWYRRNLYMYSIIQKAIEKQDKRIIILAGASHIAMFKDFIDYNPEWKSVELKVIMKK
ncbi:DUF5694 domain-containing protein [uncultured Nonlabens sp.]|uniref:DUF5694 domain-containing protein n=1 Tax=uncultured Nonlabens sp. TaxID=859306 RepID=UPI00260DA2E4|nr:DUF5694 domain-containing protein [uncultured Nonlabens sp.]